MEAWKRGKRVCSKDLERSELQGTVLVEIRACGHASNMVGKTNVGESRISLSGFFSLWSDRVR